MTTIMIYNYSTNVKNKVEELVAVGRSFTALDITAELRRVASAAQFTIHHNLVRNLVHFYMKNKVNYEKQGAGTYMKYVQKIVITQPITKVYNIVRGANGKFTIPKDLVVAAGMKTGQYAAIAFNQGKYTFTTVKQLPVVNTAGIYTVDKSNNIRCKIKANGYDAVNAYIDNGILTLEPKF